MIELADYKRKFDIGNPKTQKCKVCNNKLDLDKDNWCFAIITKNIVDDLEVFVPVHLYCYSIVFPRKEKQ